MESNIDYTENELEEMLAEKKNKNAKKQKRERVKYEAQRDKSVLSLMDEAVIIGKQLETFKKKCHDTMELQSERLKDYGSFPKKSKGGFTLTHSSAEFKITRTRSTQPHWDERSEKAVDLIKDFLGDTIKKRDLKIYEVLMTFVQRNSKGDLEYAKVMDLISHEDKWEDERWKEGLKLIKQSFSTHFRGFGYEFLVKDDETKKYEIIPINFSRI